MSISTYFTNLFSGFPNSNSDDDHQNDYRSQFVSQGYVSVKMQDRHTISSALTIEMSRLLREKKITNLTFYSVEEEASMPDWFTKVDKSISFNFIFKKRFISKEVEAAFDHDTLVSTFPLDEIPFPERVLSWSDDQGGKHVILMRPIIVERRTCFKKLLPKKWEWLVAYGSQKTKAYRLANEVCQFVNSPSRGYHSTTFNERYYPETST